MKEAKEMGSLESKRVAAADIVQGMHRAEARTMAEASGWIIAGAMNTWDSDRVEFWHSGMQIALVLHFEENTLIDLELVPR